MSRRTTRLSVLDILRAIQPEFPGVILVDTTEQTIKSGVGAIQIIGGVRKPTGKRPDEPTDKPS
jgi:hypothetical protein